MRKFGWIGTKGSFNYFSSFHSFASEKQPTVTMRAFGVVLVCTAVLVGNASAGRSKLLKKKDYDYEYEYNGAGVGGHPAADAGPSYASAGASYESPASHYGGGGGSAKGYSAGSGLRSIAQGSADQASSAVENQHAAAKQAAFVAKNTLAQAASQAAATAQAALVGKQVLLASLEQQSLEAHQALEGKSKVFL
jgi:Protein of unknown function (DUF745)